MKSAGAFKKLIDTLEPLGIVFGAVNIGHENHLTRKIGIHSLPCMTLVLDGHNYIYKDNIYSVQKVVDFIRLKLPYKTIKGVYDGNFDTFLNSWTDNKVRALIMEPRNTPRLRYLLTAYHFQDVVEFG
jgi:DnaJ homolog subfamily C member 16